MEANTPSDARGPPHEYQGPSTHASPNSPTTRTPTPQTRPARTGGKADPNGTPAPRRARGQTPEATPARQRANLCSNAQRQPDNEYLSKAETRHAKNDVPEATPAGERPGETREHRDTGAPEDKPLKQRPVTAPTANASRGSSRPTGSRNGTGHVRRRGEGENRGASVQAGQTPRERPASRAKRGRPPPGMETRAEGRRTQEGSKCHTNHSAVRSTDETTQATQNSLVRDKCHKSAPDNEYLSNAMPKPDHGDLSEWTPTPDHEDLSNEVGHPRARQPDNEYLSKAEERAAPCARCLATRNRRGIEPCTSKKLMEQQEAFEQHPDYMSRQLKASVPACSPPNHARAKTGTSLRLINCAIHSSEQGAATNAANATEGPKLWLTKCGFHRLETIKNCSSGCSASDILMAT